MRLGQTRRCMTAMQALAGEVGMSNELDDVSRSLYNGHIPAIWRRLAPATLKSLANWMLHFQQRHRQYEAWVSDARFGCESCFIAQVSRQLDAPLPAAT